MSWRDPDWLPNLQNLPNPYDCIAPICGECNDSGEVIGIRGYWVKCEACSEPVDDEPDYDHYKDRDL